MNSSLYDIANLIHGQVDGDANLVISTLSPLDDIAPNSLVFADGESNLKLAEDSDAVAILVSTKTVSSSKPLIKVSQPFKAFIQLLHHFNPPLKQAVGIHPSAVIADNVVLGKDVYIGPFVNIEAGCVIGDGCVLKSHTHIGQNVVIGSSTTIHSHVTVYDNTQIGAQVIIHASTVIGSDGFGYTYIDGEHLKVPHVGRVILEDRVEIGSNTSIDRATIGATVIGEGTKIDNLVQVAHSVQLGKNNVLCAFTGIAGSSSSGDNVIFAANVGVSDHVRIDSNVILGARTGVPPKRHLKEGEIYLGNPARPKDEAIKYELAMGRIPLIRKNIKSLTEQVKELAKKFALMEKESQ